MRLTLSMEKTFITNARKGAGEVFRRPNHQVEHYDLRYRQTRPKKANPSGSVIMLAPMASLEKKLRGKAFLEKALHTIVPQSISSYTVLPIKDIILRYRVILKGFMNYYSFVDNISKLSLIY